MSARILLVPTVLLMGGLLSSCATIIEGPSQNLTVVTDPTGANCSVSRNGSVLGIVNPTPGSLNISKSFRDVSVACDKPGYQHAIEPVPSHFAGVTLVNIILGGIIGIIVDAASGAAHYYAETVPVHLAPNEPAPAPLPAPGAATTPLPAPAAEAVPTAQAMPAEPACTPYSTDPVNRLRCEWVTGPDRDRYVPEVGRGASVRTQMDCLPSRDDAGAYAQCVARGG